MELKTKVFDEIAAARTGQKTVSDAANSIFELMPSVKQMQDIIIGEQLGGYSSKQAAEKIHEMVFKQ